MTESYRTILAALDLADDSHGVVARALALARSQNARLVLLHVIEVNTVASSAPSPPLTEELEADARKRFDALSERFRLGETHQLVRTGPLREQIVAVAKEEQVDLIVLGNRERHGLALIIGLTEDTVLHAAPCDVLTVQITHG